MRTTLMVIAIAVAATLGGCNRPQAAADTTLAQPAAGPSTSTSTAGATGAVSDDPIARGKALVEENDRAIAENNRLTAMLGRYQSQDFGKYEQLRKTCEAQAHGTLADSAAFAVARCIEAGW